MTGQFVFSTCRAAGVGLRAYLRNIPRHGEGEVRKLREGGIRVDLKVFERGDLVHHDPEFGTIPLGEVLEVSERNLPALASGGERVVCARCTVGEANDRYLPQEHQVTYFERGSDLYASVLYDQIPISKPGKPASPILLLAPKVWVGGGLNTFVVFANASARKGNQDLPMSVAILDEKGTVVAESSFIEPFNSARVLDARNLLGKEADKLKAPRFFSLVARGGSSSYAITTLVRNQTTGAMALEHSLSPHYYLSGDLARVRREGMLIPGSSLA